MVYWSGVEMKIDLWFPVAVYTNDCPFHNDIKPFLAEEIKKIQSTYPSGGDNWISEDTYNCCGTYNLSSNEKFKEINNWVSSQVNVFAELHAVNVQKKIFELQTSWLNIYEKGGWQDYHFHAGFTFSAVYCFQGDANSAPLKFESPLEPDMRPLNVTEFNELNFKDCTYNMIEGRVYIFRSYLRHCVPKHNDTQQRITLAYNYD